MRQVLKANQVRFDAPLQLSLDPGAAPAATRRSPSAAAPARARIVESHPDHAVIELTCSCGQATYLRCDYEPTQT